MVSRPVRQAPPEGPQGELTLLPPPELDQDGGGSGTWAQLLLPVVGSLGSLMFMLSNPKPLYIVGGLSIAAGSVVAGVGMHVSQRSGQRRRAATDRERYLRYLAEARNRARETAGKQHQAAAWLHPAPDALWDAVRSPDRLWERRPGDADFLHLRVGLGRRPLATPIRMGDGRAPMADTEPVCTAAARRLVAAHAWVDDQPVVVDLAGARVVSVVGDAEACRATARALLCQLAAFHGPGDVRLSLCTGPAAASAWEWCKWLPHVRPPAETDHLVVVADGVAPAEAAASRRDPRARSVTLVALVPDHQHEPPNVDVRVEVHAGAIRVERTGGIDTAEGQPDRPGPRTCEALARLLAPHRPTGAAARQAAGEADLLTLLGVPDAAALDPAHTWRHRSPTDLLRVPFGVDPEGQPVLIDLKEAALDGDGPHGVAVGATGSGKSELLRTVVSALAITHSPETLSFVLVDFKGGAAFAGLSDLPHVAGVITNLADDLALVDRMKEALFGEQRRRQELLRRAGNLANLREYHARRAADADLEPLPYLLVIVDEFSELLASKPDFIELFVAIGRLGRSLGVHLLLSSQQLDEGRLRGLENHVSYRIALRTFSASESRTVIGTPDAYHLPRLPGSGYYKAGTITLTRFRAALVSQSYRRPVPDRPEGARIQPFTLAPPFEAAPAARLPAPAPEGTAGPSVLDVVVGRLRDAARRAHQVWLPPLETALPLDRALGPLAAGPERGLRAAGWSLEGRLAVPLGLVDKPGEQAKDVLAVDLSGAGGHLAVAGAPQAGKSTLVRTLLSAFALTHTPAEVQFYCLDLGGGTLAALSGLPHVGGVCSRQERERVQRMVAQVWGLLDERERRFRELGIDSVQAFRALRRAGQVPDESYGDVFLVIDNWPALRQEYEELEEAVLDIAARGLGYGVHLVLTASRWFDIRANLLDSIAGRLELRLNEPADSLVDRRAAANVPPTVPGRGLTPQGLHFQAALPRIDGSTGTTDLQRGVDDLVGQVAAAWRGPAAPPVRVLPGRVLFTDLPAPGEDGGQGVPLGISEAGLRPAYVRLTGGEPHFLVFGDGESGKTTLLHAFLLGLVARSTPNRARILLVDYRRTLLGAVPGQHLAGYAGSPAAAEEKVTEVAGLLEARLPGADLTVEELRQRSWWSGPEMYVVVDDYDLVATPNGNPLFPLVDHLAQARDVGIHVVLARRVGGASRAMFEPLLMRLLELNTPGILLSGDPQEGTLIGGHRAEPMPPGRGRLVRRDGSELVQTAWVPAEGGLLL